MQHDAGIGQGHTVTGLTGHQEEGPHGRRHAHAQGRHWALDVLHGVIDRQTRGHHPAGRIDIERDFFFRIFRFQKQELGTDQGRHPVINGSVQKDNPLTQQARKDVEGALAPARLLDDHGNEVHHRGLGIKHAGLLTLKREAALSGRDSLTDLWL